MRKGSTTDKADESGPEVRDLADLELPPENDPDELLRHRFLCRGGGALLVGPSGIGKSSLTMQFALRWHGGIAVFGIQPARPLKILLVQAENDSGDLAEMRTGVCRGLGIPDDAAKGISVVTVCGAGGLEFCNKVLRPLVARVRPDIIILDPVFAFIGGDVSDQGLVSAFLRGGINPLLKEFGCGIVLVHHTNKPPTGREKNTWQAGDLAYLGSGSAEFTNWARAVLAVQSIGSHDTFQLHAGKRGARLRWLDDQGERVYQKFIRHARDGGIYWQEETPEERDSRESEESARGGRGKSKSATDDEVLSLFGSTNDPEKAEAMLMNRAGIKVAFGKRGWGTSTYSDRINDLVHRGRLGEAKVGKSCLVGAPSTVVAFLANREGRKDEKTC